MIVYNEENVKTTTKKRSADKQIGILLLFLLLLLVPTIGSTVAFLTAGTDSVKNIFNPSTVTCEVEETFDGTVKRNVTVKNTGEIEAYLRVRLISYRVNQAGERIGGVTDIPEFTLGEEWFKFGDHYYYSKPVAPGKTPDKPLIGEAGIVLKDYHFTFYTEEEAQENSAVQVGDIKSGMMGGGYQVIEVMAEAIQARGIVLSGNNEGTPAVTDAWGIAIGSDGRLQPGNDSENNSQTGGN